jgi:hypothetical protein
VKIDARVIVGICLLMFSWKGSEMSLPWPPAGVEKVVTPAPSAEMRAWAADVQKITPKMLPADRVYLAQFYEAMGTILTRDKNHAEGPIIKTTEQFAAFHDNSLRLAIEQSKIGIYPGLDLALDAAFLAAIGTDDPRALTDAERDRMIACCGVLTYTLGIGSDG